MKSKIKVVPLYKDGKKSRRVCSHPELKVRWNLEDNSKIFVFISQRKHVTPL